MNHDLISLAVAARRNAYCPYSKFAVGAMVETEDGSVFTGCNIENASYGLTVCAERVAIFAAVSAGHRKIKSVVVATESGSSPCGACRQVMAEFALHSDIPVTFVDATATVVQRTTVNTLLPYGFYMPVNE